MANKSITPELEEKLTEWRNWDRNETTRMLLKDLEDRGEFDLLEKIMLERIKFGTAGLRGKMDLGYTNLNDLVIIQTAQGWLKYLESERASLLKERGIVIGYDGRHNSRRWAELTASIFAQSGYPVKLLGQVCPTPFISYAIAKLKCSGGVMVTASHNPKEDNGYKVYDYNSCQIIPPVDRQIQTLILQNIQPWEFSWNIPCFDNHPLITDPLPQLWNDYTLLVSSIIFPELKECNRKVGLKFSYTAMHGVGYPYIKRVLDEIGVGIVAVEEQRDPDPEFPTVKFPNPEEGESSLELAFKTAERNDSVLVIANDPDADRFAFAEKNTTTGQWRVFSGNELGAIFGWWMLLCHNHQNPDGVPSENLYMLSSTVSSMILKTMARRHGFNFIDTLTGFKWMGNKTIDLRKQGKTVLLGYEAEIGFMCNPEILDKDGISAAAHFTSLCSYVYSKGQQIYQKLEDIYEMYGYHICKNSYFSCYNLDVIQRVFSRLRNFNGKNSYPTDILNGRYKVVSVRDLTTGYDSSEADQKAQLPLSPEMITFTFDNGFIITLRTSGTEKKIKYYSELCADPNNRDKSRISDVLNEMVDEVIEMFLQPKLNGLQPRK